MTPLAIRTLRQSQKLTQTGFGALLGTSQGVVSDWERGIAKPSGIALNAITLLQHARDLAEDLEAFAYRFKIIEPTFAPRDPALITWQKFLKDRQDL